jgi:hypothetical protein
MKKQFSFIITILMLLTSCNIKSQPSADKVQQAQTEQSMREANRQIGMPAIINFQEKKLMKEIYELRDQENLICYAYITDMNGHLHFLGKCIGYGLPYSTQFSNPDKVIDDPNGDYSAGSVVVPQPEPNGLFMPEGLSATWLLLVDPKTGKPRPVYIEPSIVVSPFPLTENIVK